jgi:hypothetical protein
MCIIYGLMANNFPTTPFYFDAIEGSPSIAIYPIFSSKSNYFNISKSFSNIWSVFLLFNSK